MTRTGTPPGQVNGHDSSAGRMELGCEHTCNMRPTSHLARHWLASHLDLSATRTDVQSNFMINPDVAGHTDVRNLKASLEANTIPICLSRE